ncbi:hypothetical protein [Pseudomonas thivervalensis]|jgi:hypothetical protein|uniref:hypothetical protein n=1 Tax=Pseudomonas thivervalensis TaxID=86265 RepID=UPI00069DA6D8|nr:hypothetical protein [Pseudomonas thivervalensis]OAB54290.1 hypothetical protein APS14_15125 [Pseudomonas thivervalensis]SDF38769.1 hypothetical protein SAMN04490204_0545 [Pseudomonas thivervalensis]
MSVLNFPRIYLNGHMFWNPPTANNNDVFPLYDAVNADINWPFMSHFDINATNAPTQLMPWAIKPLAMSDLPTYVLQVPTNANPKTYPYMPAEWDLFGDNACGTVSYKGTRSTIIGGELQANTYITEDALVGRDYQLLGNPFGSNAPTAARFVDVSPWQNTFTALYFDKLMLGDATCGLTLNRQYRMMDRFLNFNWGALGGLVYVTTTWQSCFPQENLEWVIGDSALLSNLQQQMKLQGAKGLMFRFSTYLTCYDRNGVFNDFPYVNTRSNAPTDTARLQAMYQKGLDNVSGIFFNPAYSRTAATLGLWFADEYPTAPAGLRLVPVAAVPIIQTSPPRDVAPTKLGVVSAQVTGNTLSLDLTNTFPFYPVDATAPILTAEKFQAGDYQLGVREGDQFTSVVDFGYEQYRQCAFDKRSGLLDFALNDDNVKALQSGTLELQRKSPAPAKPVTAAAQQTWTAEVIESGSFIDVGDHKTLNIMVQKNGVPAANTTLWVAEYGNPYMVTSSDYYLAFSNAANFTLFYDDPTDRNFNQANLPQFNDAPPVSNYLATGSGRRLTALQNVHRPTSTPVGYLDFLNGPGKPIAVNLQPCLAFDAGVYVTGTLNDNQATQVDYSYVTTTTDANGIAQVSFRAVTPGFPTLRFFVKDGDSDPAIPFSFPLPQAYIDFLTPLRVLPLDMQLQQDFINYWNTVYKNKDAATELWEGFLYPRILQTFYYLYPIMNKYMPLNSQARVEGAIDQLIVLISKPYQEESTLSMPITRDMSQSRRAVLELWAKKLVKRNYPPQQLKMSDYDNL